IIMAQQQHAADVHSDELCPPNKRYDHQEETRTRLGLRSIIRCMPSLAEHKSREEQEARENMALVDEHLAAQEIEKLVENPENVNDSSPPRHDDTSIPSTRLEPRSDKESPEVEIV
ncbi:hypothetical protein Tco_1558127, partial [Tanacetum coccineum]